nr:hypothetical protein [Tanacetum cinerariifolium]
MSSDNASFEVTYRSIASDSDGPSWGIPLMESGELLKMDPYEEVAQQGQAPPLSPAYVPDPIELDEHVPVYVLELEHPEYHVPSDDDMQVEDHPYADDASLIVESLDTLLTLSQWRRILLIIQMILRMMMRIHRRISRRTILTILLMEGTMMMSPSIMTMIMMILMMRMRSPLRTRMMTRRRST